MRLLLPLLVLLLAGPALADRVYVLNSLDPGIQVVDPRTRADLARIPVLREPHHLVLSPARDVLLIGDSAGNEILFVNPATSEVLRRERISNPYHLEFSPDGRSLVVTGLRRNQVDLYGWDGESLTLQARLRPGDMPSHIAFSPDGAFAYVTLQGSRTVAAIEVASRSIAWTATVGRDPAGILWHEGRLLVGIMGSDHVAVLDPGTRQVERRIVVGRGAHAVFRGPDGTLWVTSRVDSRITALDPATLDVRRAYEVPGGPDCLSFDPEGRVWATLRWSRQLGRLDPATGELITSPVGRSPHGVLFHAAADRVAGGS